MADISDIPYIQGPEGPQRSDPVVVVNKGKWTDRSGQLDGAGVVMTLFDAAAVDEDGNQSDFTQVSRFVCNINVSGILWVNFFGGQAEAGSPGSFPVPSYASLEIPTDGLVTMCGDVDNMFYTAGVC